MALSLEVGNIYTATKKDGTKVRVFPIKGDLLNVADYLKPTIIYPVADLKDIKPE